MPAEVPLALRLLEDDERFEIADSATIGRHLDNDLIVAGEAVSDFHARLARADRGLLIAVIADSSVRVNGQHIDAPTGLVPGDVIEIGHIDVLVEQIGDADPAMRWRLIADGDKSVCEVDEAVLIGRGDDCDLVLADNHISRRHASVNRVQGAVWLRDLGSSNGSYVNGERVVGGCQLFHGDHVRFDTAGYQLLAEGGDLTPARPLGETRHRPLAFTETSGRVETTELAVVSADALPSVPESEGVGAYLVGLSDPVDGRIFPLSPGRVRIGREVDCEIWLDDPAVSQQHCELLLSAEGVHVTSLRTRNGTFLNGEAVLSGELSDGDVLQCAGVRLGFRAGRSRKPDDSRTGFWILVGAAILLSAATIGLWLTR